MRKKVLLSLLILIIAASVLTACNKGKDKNPAVTYGDIYVQHGGIVRKTDYDHDRSFVLPEGLMPYYEEKGTVNTYKEYVDAYDKENGCVELLLWDGRKNIHQLHRGRGCTGYDHGAEVRTGLSHLQ